ncbi:MAG: helix-turn-helix domain-containing protein [Erysipelotrichaceae bacterium]|jgi:cyanate lyase
MIERRLKAKCIEKDVGFDELSQVLGISVSTFYRKISNVTFTIKEVRSLAEHLKLTEDEILFIFFDKMLHISNN